MKSTYLCNEFVSTKMGDAIRIFRFGKIVRGGQIREVTRALAAKFKLPHFKPAIKLGSHEESTPAGGHLVGLEVREDGLYGIPEFNKEGQTALEKGSYRYHSPEVIWDDGGFEDPTNGDILSGPLIVGMALLHEPHLGEQAALYQVEPLETHVQEVITMGEEGAVTLSVLEKVVELVKPKPVEDEAEPEIVVQEPEDYAAIKEENENLKAEAEKREADEKEAATREEIREKFKAEPLSFLVKEDGAMDVLASMTEEQREWVAERFSAIAEQVDLSKLLEESGIDGDGDTDPVDVNAAVDAYATEHKITYVEAFDKLRVEKPELFKQKQEE